MYFILDIGFESFCDNEGAIQKQIAPHHG